MVDIGFKGSASDGGVWENSAFKDAVETGDYSNLVNYLNQYCSVMVQSPGIFWWGTKIYFFLVIVMVTIMILYQHGTKPPGFTVLFLSVGHISIPSASALPNTNVKANYVFVADEVFPLKPYLMRPFPGRELEDSENRSLQLSFV